MTLLQYRWESRSPMNGGQSLACPPDCDLVVAHSNGAYQWAIFETGTFKHLLAQSEMLQDGRGYETDEEAKFACEEYYRRHLRKQKTGVIDE